MKLPSISLLATTLAALVAGTIADGEPVALFKRQASRQQLPPLREVLGGYLPSQQGSQPFHQGAQQQSHEHQPHHQALHRDSADQQLQQGQRGHHLTQQRRPHGHHQGQRQAQPLQDHPHHQAPLQAHQDQLHGRPQLSREAHLYGFQHQHDYEAHLKTLSHQNRMYHDHHTAVAIQSQDAAHANRLAAANALLAESLRVPVEPHRQPQQEYHAQQRQEPHGQPQQVQGHHAPLQDQPLSRKARLNGMSEEAYSRYLYTLGSQPPRIRQRHHLHTNTAIECGDAAHHSQLAINDLNEAKRLGVNFGYWGTQKIASYTKKVEKQGLRKEIQRGYAKEISTDMQTPKVREAWEAARKCKDEAIATSNAVWRAIISHHRHLERPHVPDPE